MNKRDEIYRGNLDIWQDGTFRVEYDANADAARLTVKVVGSNDMLTVFLRPLQAAILGRALAVAADHTREAKMLQESPRRVAERAIQDAPP